MGFTPVVDEEVTVEMLVRVTTFGKPDRANNDVEAEVRRALHLSFGDRFTVLTAPFGTHYDQLPLDGPHDRDD